MLPNFNSLHIDAVGTQTDSPSTSTSPASKRLKCDEQLSPDRCSFKSSNSSNSRTTVEVPDDTPKSVLTRYSVRCNVANDQPLFCAFGKFGIVSNVSFQDYEKSINSEFDVLQTLEGTFNQTTIARSKGGQTTAQPSLVPSWMTPAAYGLSTTTIDSSSRFAFRSTKSDIRMKKVEYDAHYEDLLEELYLTLYASYMGVGPSVYFAMITSSCNTYAKLHLMLEGGEGIRCRFLLNEFAQKLIESCERAAKAGLLLLDNKIENTIFLHNKVLMIDFGADFTFQLFDATVKQEAHENENMFQCLFLMNLILLATYIRCWTSFPVAYGGLGPRSMIIGLKQKIIELHEISSNKSSTTLCDIANSIRIPEKWKMQLHSHADASCVSIQDIEKPQRRSETHAHSGMIDEDEYQMLVYNFVSIIRYYTLNYLKTGGSYCNFTWNIDTNKTFIEQLIEFLDVM